MRCWVVWVVSCAVEVDCAGSAGESFPDPVEAWMTTRTATAASKSARGAIRRAALRRRRFAIAILPQKGDAELRALQLPRGEAQFLGRGCRSGGGLSAPLGMCVHDRSRGGHEPGGRMRLEGRG